MRPFICLPMTLIFQGHDLYKITFWAISVLLLCKTLLSFIKTILRGLHVTVHQCITL